MIRTVIFDMDGLMIDSEAVQSKAFEEVIRDYEKEPIFLENGLVQITGLRADDNWKILKDKHDIQEDIEVLREKRRVVYKKLLETHVNALPGLKELLVFLKKKKITLAIASSSHTRHIHYVLEKLQIADYFSAIVGGEYVIKSKPHPEIFLLAAKALGVSPKECLVLEDAENGVIAAKAAKMNVIAVPNRYTVSQDFSQANNVVASLKEVIKEIDKIR